MSSSGGSSGGGGGGGGGGSDKDKEKEKRAGNDAAEKEKQKDSISSSGGDSGTPYQTQTPAPSSILSKGETGGGGGATGGGVGTTVNQKPAENTEGPENTSITATPRSDFSVVLAGQVGRRADRSPSRSNNFVSLVGGAGGLGRRSAESKRTLIGGA